MKFEAYAFVSFLFAVSVVAHAWTTRVDYYPTAVFITTNKLAQVVMGNFLLVIMVVFAKLIRTIFLGPLRDIEVEVMYENARYAITETCLALTIFRGDISATVIILFTMLLFVKAFHWLAQARMEHLEQAGRQSLTSMVRLWSLLLLNLMVDVTMVKHCMENIVLEQQPSVLVLFAFEYAILSVAASSTILHLGLDTIDISMAGAWHGKATWTMLLEFFSEVWKLSFYVIFFLVMFLVHGVLPIHLARDIFISFGQLQRRLLAIIRYRRLIATMDERFPDATEEELAECEHTCIICRDTMSAGKKLPCSHIFHFQCLRLWLQQQQACPTCRAIIPVDGPSAAIAAAAAAARLRAAAAAAEVGEAVARNDDHALGGGGGVGEAPVAVPGLGEGRDHQAAAATTDSSSSTEDSSESSSTTSPSLRSVDSYGFSTFVVSDRLKRAKGETLPEGMLLRAVFVISKNGVVIRSGVESNAAARRTEPSGSMLLLMAPPLPCGSLAVYGGYVGGPGKEEDVLLVNLTELSLEQAESSFADFERKSEAEEDQKEEYDADVSGDSDAAATAFGDEMPRQDEGLRRRVAAGKAVQG